MCPDLPGDPPVEGAGPVIHRLVFHSQKIRNTPPVWDAMAVVFGAHDLLNDGGGIGALLVTAHPDDETLFFSPALLALCDMLELHVLCLSTGNYDGLGAVRSAELLRACAVLGISAERVEIVDDAEMQDGPKAHWSAQRVASIVNAHLVSRGLLRVLTFDAQGVTGHANHKGVERGVLHLLGSAGSQRPRVYSLHSVGVLRHYLGWCDVPITVLAVLLQRLCCRRRARRMICCVSLKPWRCHAAMQRHASQYVWHRRLNVLFSRYVHVNTLIMVSPTSEHKTA